MGKVLVNFGLRLGFCALLIGCQKLTEPNKVYLIKQWHLGANTNTLNIEKAKELPQYPNQLNIYKRVKKLIEKQESKVVIAEGCQGEISLDFKESFNGWTLPELIKRKDDSNFKHIMAPVPMKIKAKFPEVEVICGDSLNLINKNLRAMSDLRGYLGFYQKMKETEKSNEEFFKKYLIQLQKIHPDEDIQDPIGFSLNKSVNALEEFEDFILKRNDIFYSKIKSHMKKNPILVIGGLHVDDLQKKLESQKLGVKVITPKGYSNDEKKLLIGMKEILYQESRGKLLFNQLPKGFSVNSFPVKNKLLESAIFTPAEAEEMKKVIGNHLKMDLLLSDYDQDGIRDFTLSSNGKTLILSAEDTDWDNDGLDNLVDPILGTFRFQNSKSVKLMNNYFSTQKGQKIVSRLSKKFTLLSGDETPHEQLVLEVLEKILELKELEEVKIKYIVATKPKFSYGNNVFFSYVKHTQALEYYPRELSHYINQEFQKRFQGVDFKKIIEAFVLPIMVHSLSHEIGHSILQNELELAKELGWNWKEIPYKGRYLNTHRHPLKQINTINQEFLFRKKSLKEWKKSLTKFNKIFYEKKRLVKGSKENNDMKKSAFYQNIKGLDLEYKMSFLYFGKIPSLYSIQKPEEYTAEVFAACIYQKLYPASKGIKRSIELEHLIGFAPGTVSEATCEVVLGAGPLTKVES